MERKKSDQLEIQILGVYMCGFLSGCFVFIVIGIIEILYKLKVRITENECVKISLTQFISFPAGNH